MYPEGQLLKLQFSRKLSKSTEEHRLPYSAILPGKAQVLQFNRVQRIPRLISRKLDWQGKFEDKGHKPKARP